MLCHGKKDFRAKDAAGKERSLYVDVNAFRGSTHGKLSCVDCHLDTMELPHGRKLKQVNCGACHYRGRTFGQGPAIEYLLYRDSVHARERQKGNMKAPDCASCHGTHDILSRTDIHSRGYKLNIPEQMCGKCHTKELADWKASVHGPAVHKGDLNLPVCTNCHSEHGIRRAADPGSTVYATNIVEMCIKCHGDFSIMQRYGKNTEEVESYYESFHGVATKFGEKNIAHCASCHGYHLILARDNPASSVNPARLPATCGQPKCHPGATANFAKGKVHVNPKSKDSGIIYWVALGFKWLTITVLIVLFIHIFLDFLRKVQERRKRGS
ncbi:MAG TPA: hypothetical protein VMT71_17915 [Syntrophorhabdales bacterium]|nr:hypothetical protein [Syntrophorhabdales bacterium]